MVAVVATEISASVRQAAATSAWSARRSSSGALIRRARPPDRRLELWLHRIGRIGGDVPSFVIHQGQDERDLAAGVAQPHRDIG